jgi:hypothetical protein
MNKKEILLAGLLAVIPVLSNAQCLSSVNPVGGTNNLLVLEKNTLRVISFYKYGQGNRYFEGASPSDFVYIKDASYNYLSATVGYGLTQKLTLEMETGYFFNKTQNYISPLNSHTGKGLSNMVFLVKHSIYTNPFKRIFITGSGGAKIPFSRDYQLTPDNVELPVEVQPTMGAYGVVFTASFVKESSGTGMRYFFTNRVEVNAPNKYDYKLGTSVYNSFYISSHLKYPWLKDNWTAILQLRNEIRTPDKMAGRVKEASGSNLLFVAPQLNYVLKDDWYLSAMVDIPVYQNFNGKQLGAGTGFTFIVSKTFWL